MTGSNAATYNSMMDASGGGGGGGANARGGYAVNGAGPVTSTGGAAGAAGAGGGAGAGTSSNSGGGANGGGGGGGGGGGDGTTTVGGTTAVTGGAGGAGGASSYLGGGGGGGAGGAGINAAGTTTFTVNANASGGAGGAGGQSVYGGGGGGGGGGYGLQTTGARSITVGGNATVRGGAGGAGGNSTYGYRSGGDGGSGGVGVYLAGTLTNQGTIIGGAGGAAGAMGGAASSADPAAVAGAGGAGVMGANLSITNIGTISAGSGADAITYTGGANALTLSSKGVSTPNIIQGTINGAIGLTGTLSLDPGNGYVNAPTNATLANVIHDAAGGAGSVTKVGTGTLTLSGANTYTGTTTISVGTLAVSGGAAISDVSAVTIASGATLQLNASETIGSLAGAGNVTLGANTLTTGGLNASPTFSGVASGTGGLTKVGTGTLTLSGANSYTGATTVNAGTLALGATNAIAAGSALTVGTGATFDLTTFDDTVASAALNGALNGTGTLTAATYTLNGATVNGNLGTGTLSQAGGLSTLNGTSAAGTVTVDGGILVTGGAERIDDNAAVTIASGAVLSLGGAETIGSLSGQGNVALGANMLTTGGLNDDQTYSGTASGTGGLTKAGTGTLTLSGTNTYTGATTIAAGTLALGTYDAILASSAVDLTDASAILQGDNFAINNLSGVAGSQVLTADGYSFNVTKNVDTVFNGTIGTYGGTTYGTELDLNGPAALTLTAASTGVYYVDVGEGALNLVGAGALTNADIYIERAAVFDVSGVTGSATSVLSIGSSEPYDGMVGGLVNLGTTTLTLTNANDNAYGVITGSGGITVAGGTEYFNGNTNTYTGATIIDTGASLYLRSYTDNASIAASSGVQADGVFSIEQQNGHYTNNGGTADATEPATAISNLTGGTGGQVLLGLNALSITNANGTFAGVISDQVGMATFNTNGNYTGKSYTSAGAGVRIAGTLVLSGDNTYTGATTLDGAAVALGAGGTTGSVAGPIVFAGTDTTRNTLTVNRSDAVTIAQAISGAGSVVQAGAGTTALDAANSYTGTTTIAAGTLTLGATGSIAASSGVIDNATFDIGGHTGDASITTLSGSNAGLVTLGANTLTLTDAADTFAGTIAGTGGLTLTAGREILTGANSVAAGQFTGVVNVDGGTLSVNGIFGDTAANTAQVNVNAGGTLHGSGTIDGSVAVTNGGTVSAGNSPGTLTVAGNYTLGMGSTSLFELGTPGVVGGMTNDLINVGGNLTLGGTLSLVNSADATMAPVSGDYRLFNYGGTLAGQFAAITSPTTASAFTVTTGIPGQVNLSVAAAGQSIQYFDGADTTGAIAGVQGGTGVWDAATTNWTDRTGAANATWQSGVGIFTTTGGMVTVAGAQAFQGLQFSADGYRLGGTGTLTVTGDPYSTTQQSFVNVDAGVGVTIANAITGAAGIGLIKLGTGTLTLSGANTYTGATTVSAGTLALGANGTIGAGSDVTVASGATLDMATYNDTVASAALAGTLAGTGTLTAATYTLNGATVNANLGAGTLTQASVARPR